MSGGLGALSMAWVEAEAAMPLGWRLMALVPDADSDDWLAPLRALSGYGPLRRQSKSARPSTFTL